MEGDEHEILLPCAICGRTFVPRSLEKHARICERAAVKKRKPFDSAKQRIQGTNLAEFLPRQEKKRHYSEEKRKSSWKETHDDLLRTIRAARSETTTVTINQRQSSSHVSSGAPTRANEKGTCPTCNRQFGIKAYDRHVAWCKERSTRLPISPATKNIAKERLEARMKYRAPALKNRRQSNRDKYSQSCKAVKTPIRVKETVSVPDNTRDKIKENLIDSQRPSTTGRGEQSNNTDTYYLRDTIDTTKRPIDRPTSCSRTIIPEPRTTNLPLLISLKPKKKTEAKVQLRRLEMKTIDDGSYDINPLDRRNESANKYRPSVSSSSVRSVLKVDRFFTARNQTDSKVNDVTVNDNVLGMIVQPCNIYSNNDRYCDYDENEEEEEEEEVEVEVDKKDELITWEVMKIDRERNKSHENIVENIYNDLSSNNKRRLLECTYFNRSNDKSCNGDKKDRNLPLLVNDLSIRDDDASFRFDNYRDDIVTTTWSSTVKKLNRTYLIKDSTDREILSDRNILNDFNRLNDTSDNNNNNNNKISARENLSEINRENVLIDDEKIDHDSTSNCSLTETKSEICEIKKWDLVEDKIINNNNNNQSEGTCYEDRIIENKMIDGIITDDLSSSSEIERIVNETKDSTENIKINENDVQTLLVDEEYKKNTNDSMFDELIDANDSCNSRVSIDLTNTKSSELRNVCETYANEQFQYSIEEEKEKEVGEEEEEEEEEENDDDDEKNEADIDDEKSTIINDRDNDTRISLTIDSRPPIKFMKINSKIQENMNLLRGSTDTLISSIEAVDYVNNKRSKRINNSICKENGVNLSRRIATRYDKCDKLPEIRRNVKTIDNDYDLGEHCYWKKTMKYSNDRSINDLMFYNCKQNRLLHKRNPKIRILPPVLVDYTSPRIQSGGDTCKEYDPFLLAERQMNDLLSDSASDLSLSEIASTSSTPKSLLPLSHSSAFVKYPYQTKTNRIENKSMGNELDELISDLSSDSTETNSLSREIFYKDYENTKLYDRNEKILSNKEYGRRMLLDKSLILGNDIAKDASSVVGLDKQYKNDIIINKSLEKVSSSTKNPTRSSLDNKSVNKSQTIRAFSAPKSIYQRKTKNPNTKGNNNQSVKLDNNVKNDYLTFSSSDLSLNSIVSTEIGNKRSNSVFDQLIRTSFDDEDDIVGNDSFPSLRSLLRNESLRTSSNCQTTIPDNNDQFNGQISDDEFSSTENYKQREHKINADSAYNSLNRKYSNHGRSGNNNPTNRIEDNNTSRNNRRENQSAITKTTKSRMSRFCHECGSRFLETAKFCCQCGVKRLAL